MSPERSALRGTDSASDILFFAGWEVLKLYSPFGILMFP